VIADGSSCGTPTQEGCRVFALVCVCVCVCVCVLAIIERFRPVGHVLCVCSRIRSHVRDLMSRTRSVGLTGAPRSAARMSDPRAGIWGEP
jgi:hypothetical protein